MSQEYSNLDPKHAYIAWSYLSETKDYLAKALVRGFGPGVALDLVNLGIRDFSSFRRELLRPDLGLLDGKSELGQQLYTQLSRVGQQRWRNLFARVELGLQSMDIGRLLARAERLGVKIFTPLDSLWSAELDNYVEAPFCLWTLGNQNLLAESSAKRVGIVGSRLHTDLGSRAAADITAGLVEAGYQTISGGALGIDSVCHRSTLLQQGQTIAVMASGLDRWYPSANSRLFAEIKEQGLLISQYALGIAPAKWRFLERNWIVAALSTTVIVVQASARSGALNTARHAVELGKNLGVVPGSLYANEWAGSLELIRAGASLVRDSSDALELISPLDQDKSTQGGAGKENRGNLGGVEKQVYAIFSKQPELSLPELAARSGLAPNLLAAALEKLCFEGYLRAVTRNPKSVEPNPRKSVDLAQEVGNSQIWQRIK